MTRMETGLSLYISHSEYSPLTQPRPTSSAITVLVLIELLIAIDFVIKKPMREVKFRKSYDLLVKFILHYAILNYHMSLPRLAQKVTTWVLMLEKCVLHTKILFTISHACLTLSQQNLKIIEIPNSDLKYNFYEI